MEDSCWLVWHNHPDNSCGGPQEAEEAAVELLEVEGACSEMSSEMSFMQPPPGEDNTATQMPGASPA